VRDERAIAAVPASARALLALALALQLGWQAWQPPAKLQPQDLSAPPAIGVLRLASFGEPVALAKGLLIYLQAYESQRGEIMQLRRLDYDHVQAWLLQALTLDPLSQYPLLLASRVYAEVEGAEPKQRAMLAFVRQQFDVDPNRRWPWLAHAAVLARHRLEDMDLAREYAQALRLQATGPEVPTWAKQMEILLLQDLGELETARILLGALVASRQVRDDRELAFLQERLAEIEARLAGQRVPAPKP
jgi:hypothetical protein